MIVPTKFNSARISSRLSFYSVPAGYRNSYGLAVTKSGETTMSNARALFWIAVMILIAIALGFGQTASVAVAAAVATIMVYEGARKRDRDTESEDPLGLSQARGQEAA